ncbi:recombinase family protein [Anaerorhabdus sp.]|uniref:recombinase family protein n=1 Tax=Anaerorhabdus sp. TaxID=1872524 RepID=UPI002FCB0958
MNPKVTIIAPTVNEEPVKTGAYARVSSKNLGQKISYQNQVNYYEDYIKKDREAYFSGVYADEGITGTSISKRIGFQKMMEDARTGKIDRIITKSITRFGRNLTETLYALRKLKDYGVSVYFEQDNIDTATVQGELKVSMGAFLAESESRTLSQTAKWSYRKRAVEGYFNQPKLPYGYYRKNKVIEVDEYKARIIRLLFKLYVTKDISTDRIRKKFNHYHIGKREWSRSGLVWMLSNERYCGDMLLQKKYSPDVFPYKLSINKGELPQYYVYNSFPKIIDRELYEKSMAKLHKTRLKLSEAQLEKNRSYAFTSMIMCEHCSSVFKRRVHKGKVSWACATHLIDRTECDIKQINEEELKEAFVRLFYKLKSNIFILEAYRDNLVYYTVSDDMNMQLYNIDKKIYDLQGQLQKNYEGCEDDSMGNMEYINCIHDIKVKISCLKKQKEMIKVKTLEEQRDAETNQLLSFLRDCEWIKEFDENLFKKVIKNIKVNHSHIIFTLKNSLAIKIERKIYDGNYSN